MCNLSEGIEERAMEAGRKAGIEEGRKTGLELGKKDLLKQQVQKKLLKGKDIDVIAEELEEEVAVIEKVIFMNMCMVYDKEGNVVALDKVGKNYSGTTFPGGHVEPGETFKESVIREIYEETGLMIQNPRLTGIYHWMTGDIRNVGFLYKTSEYEGKLISSEEGKVYWISGEQFLKKPLAPGMEQVWQMMHDENAQECLQTLTEEGIVSKIQ